LSEIAACLMVLAMKTPEREMLLAAMEPPK
jgi:hypothetical protein